MTHHDSCCSAGTTRRGALGVVGAGSGALVTACTADTTPATDHASPALSEPTALSGDAEGFRTRLVLLGTAAGPVFTPGRAGISSALQVGDRYSLVDVGLGAARRLGQAGLTVAGLGGVFITHLHSDHLFDLFNVLWMTPGGLSGPVAIHGPGSANGLPEPFRGEAVPLVRPQNPTPGTTDMVAHVLSAYAYDMNIRNTETGAQTDHEGLLMARDIAIPPEVGAKATRTAPAMEPLVVFEDDRIRVRAVLVPHGPVFPSFAFRFDTAEGSVTFSGDTACSDNVARLAQGSDILVHEVVNLDWFARNIGPGVGYGPGFLEHMKQTHTTPEDVGRVATAANVPHVVLSHIAPGDPREIPDDAWRSDVSKTYRGKVTPGNDLTQIGVGKRR